MCTGRLGGLRKSDDTISRFGESLVGIFLGWGRAEGAWSLDIREGFFKPRRARYRRLFCRPKCLGNLAEALRLGLGPEGPRELSPGFSLGRLPPHGRPVGASDQGLMDRK
jgi:hypothetical protein